MLIVLIPGELWEDRGGRAPPPKIINIFNISLFFKHILEKLLETGEMLIM